MTLDVDRAMRWMRELRRDHVPDAALAALDRPAPILGAGLNRWHAVPNPQMTERLAALIPGAELAVAEGWGRCSRLEDPGFALDRLLPFLDRASRTSRDTPTDY